MIAIFIMAQVAASSAAASPVSETEANIYAFCEAAIPEVPTRSGEYTIEAQRKFCRWHQIDAIKRINGRIKTMQEWDADRNRSPRMYDGLPQVVES